MHKLVYAKSVREADFAKTQYSRFGQAERLQISFGTFLVLHKKSTHFFFLSKRKKLNKIVSEPFGSDYVSSIAEMSIESAVSTV